MSSERSSASDTTATTAINHFKTVLAAKSLLTAFSFSLTLLPTWLNLATPAACASSKHQTKSGHSRNLIAAKSGESKDQEDDDEPAKSKDKGKAEDKKSDEKVDDKKAKAKETKAEKEAKSDKDDKKLKADKSRDKDDEPVATKKGFFNRGKDPKADKEEKVVKATKETKEVKEVKNEKAPKKEIVKAKPAPAPAPAAVVKEVEKKAEVKEEKALLFEPDTALISVLKDLNRTLKEPEEQNKIEDVNQRMIVSLASDVLNKALSEPSLAFNRILAKEQENKARTRMAAEAWSSGDVAVNDKFHGSIATVWAKRIDGLVTVTIAGDCHDRRAKDGSDIGEFLVVVTAKSPVETGFDIQSQANVNFWMGKLSNILVEADCIAKQAEGEKVEGEEKSDRERKVDLDKKSDGDLQKKKSLAALPPLLTNRYRSYYEMIVLKDNRRRLIAQQLAEIDFVAKPAAADKKSDEETKADDIVAGDSSDKAGSAKIGDEKKPATTKLEKVEKIDKIDKIDKVAVVDKKSDDKTEKVQVASEKTVVEKTSIERTSIEKASAEKTVAEQTATEKSDSSAKNKVVAVVEKEPVVGGDDAVNNVDDEANVIVHTKPSASSRPAVTTATKPPLTSTTSAVTDGTLSGSSAPNIAMVTTSVSPTARGSQPVVSTNTNNTITNFDSRTQASTRPHGKQGNETAYAGAAASMERVTGLDLPALKQPKNFTMLLPDRALAGQPLTVAFVDDQSNPESNVELSFNGVTLSTDQNGQAQYMVPEDETPGRSLNVALLSRPYEMPSVVEVLQPLNTPESAQAPKVDKASHLVSRRSHLVIDGHNFDGVAQNNRVIIDGMTEATIAAASPVQLKVNLPKALRPGPHSLCVSTEGMRSNPIGFELAQLEVACDPNSNRVIVRVVGTTSKVNVKLVNLSPELIKLTKGDDTKLVSSGGPDNTASVAVQRIKKGNTRVEAWIEL